MRKHGIGNVCLKWPVDQIEQRVEGPVCIPKGKHGNICKTGCSFDILVVSSESAVGILEYERVQGGMVHAGVECFLQFSVFTDKPVLAQFALLRFRGFLSYSIKILPFKFFKVFSGTVRTDR